MTAMRCTTCRDRFSERFDGRLPSALERRVDEHLVACAGCAAEFAAYRRTFEAVRGVVGRRAPAFVRPPELPGARPTVEPASAVAAARRFAPARFAAGLVLFAGLALSHGMVFRWASDHGGAEGPMLKTQGGPPALSSSLGRLRDHVDATDLFLRAASAMPDEAGARGRELLRADLERLELARLTDELSREASLGAADERGPMFGAYLSASSRLLGRLHAELDGGSLQGVREAAATSTVPGMLAELRPAVMPFASGGTFARRRGALRVAELRNDERAFFDARDARLAGDFPKAFRGFVRFQDEYQASKLAPLASYLLAEAYARVGNFGDVPMLLANLEQRGVHFLPSDELVTFAVIAAKGPRGGIKLPEKHVQLSYNVLYTKGVGTATMRVDRVEPMAGPLPPNAAEFLEERGLSARLTVSPLTGGELTIHRAGLALPADEYPKLYAAVRQLVSTRYVPADRVGPTELDAPSPAAAPKRAPPAEPAPRPAQGGAPVYR
ncbi:MAG TPA: zf-HC2 domain-containing protein [Planctomycetota bacterium]|nr:zf-HC2 domain-containing protein [Planctomycetota bacterium]